MMAAAAQSRSRSSAAAAKAAAPCSPSAAVVPVEIDEEEHGHRRQPGGAAQKEEAESKAELRRGPWTVDEDLTLVNYIADNGEGRWNNLARAAGLKRTGKSCRLRWLNYLRPDVKRGNFSADEQLLILDLHTRWGNRWSKIAQHLPGRTDNEIKNYWRTRVQKHAKQLNCDANSKRFKDAMRYLWMPHLVDVDIAAAAAASAAAAADHHHHHHHLRLLQAAAAGGGAANDDDLSAAAGGYAAGGGGVHQQLHARALSTGMAAIMTSSSDSLASEPYEDGGGGGLFANVGAAAAAAAGEMILMNSGRDWGAPHQEVANQGLWTPPSSDHDQSVPVLQAADDAACQVQDPDLCGWVQGFSESITDNFWALEEIWKMH